MKGPVVSESEPPNKYLYIALQRQAPYMDLRREQRSGSVALSSLCVHFMMSTIPLPPQKRRGDKAYLRLIYPEIRT